jgi:hypothetical protein
MIYRIDGLIIPVLERKHQPWIRNFNPDAHEGKVTVGRAFEISARIQECLYTGADTFSRYLIHQH